MGQFDSNLVQAVAQEMMKYMNGKTVADGSFAHFAGMIRNSSLLGKCCAVSNGCCDSWIVDTGAFDHMTSNLKFFTNLQPLKKPIHVTLPNGSLKVVTHAGQVPLCSKLILQNVLYVPDFKFSLISVHKLITDLHLLALFTPEKCIF